MVAAAVQVLLRLLSVHWVGFALSSKPQLFLIFLQLFTSSPPCPGEPAVQPLPPQPEMGKK